jgi:membrane dipeptidase
MRRILIGLALLIVLILLVPLVAPHIIETKYNRVLSKPPYQSSAAARSFHPKLMIVDLHADSLLWGRNLLERSSNGHVDIPRLVEGNVAIQIFDVVTKTPKHLNINSNDDKTDNISALAIAEGWPPSTWKSLKQRALYQAHRLSRMVEQSHGKFVMLRTASDLDDYLNRRADHHDTIAALLGLEGAHALEGNLDNLDELYKAGFRIASPTHFFDNDIAGSSTGVRKAGLTPKGQDFVRRMEAHNMLIDLAHASSATIDDVTQMATRPVIVSHTGVRGTCNNQRNLSDADLRAIARTGGLIGIGYWNTAICGSNAAAIARAIRYAVNIAGIEHVSIGSDFDGSTTMPFDTTGLVQITDALLNEGFSESEIQMIVGGNAIRLLRRVLPK